VSVEAFTESKLSVKASVRGKGPSPRGIPLSAKTSNPVVVVQQLLADGMNREHKVQQAVKGIMVEAVVLDWPLTRPLLRIPQR
jgi:hypothetical protein